MVGKVKFLSKFCFSYHVYLSEENEEAMYVCFIVQQPASVSRGEGPDRQAQTKDIKHSLATWNRIDACVYKNLFSLIWSFRIIRLLSRIYASQEEFSCQFCSLTRYNLCPAQYKCPTTFLFIN